MRTRGVHSGGGWVSCGWHWVVRYKACGPNNTTLNNMGGYWTWQIVCESFMFSKCFILVVPLENFVCRCKKNWTRTE